LEKKVKLVKTASGKHKIKISRKEWENIGRLAGWSEPEVENVLDYDPKKPLQVEDVVFDNKDGAGAVPDNIDSNYKGFTILMTPDEFLKLAAPLTGDIISDELTNNRLGTPFLVCEWQDGKWQVLTHEGRHRVIALRKKLSSGVRIPVNIFGTDSYNRARYLTKEMIHAPFVPENGGDIVQLQGTVYLGGRIASGYVSVKNGAK
jgi:hypothetical protein